MTRLRGIASAVLESAGRFAIELISFDGSAIRLGV
jgi:hypothetical protein